MGNNNNDLPYPGYSNLAALNAAFWAQHTVNMFFPTCYYNPLLNNFDSQNTLTSNPPSPILRSSPPQPLDSSENGKAQ